MEPMMRAMNPQLTPHMMERIMSENGRRWRLSKAPTNRSRVRTVSTIRSLYMVSSVKRVMKLLIMLLSLGNIMFS